MIETVVDIGEGVAEVARDAFAKLARARVVHEVGVLGQPLLQLARQLCLDVGGDFVAVDAVAVADDEQVEALLPAHVRRQRVRVLVNFVGIAWLMAARSGEGKLGDCIETLLRAKI